jgi:ubiquitin carboxyl-terminal hydrolase 7
MFYKCHLYEFFWLVFRYKFDDERVTKEDTKKALEEQYGGEEEVTFFITNVHSVQCSYLWTSINFLFLLCMEQLPQINPGFNNTPFKFTKYSNAYMLVYIRESDKEKIMCNVDEKDIAEHLRVSSSCILSTFLYHLKYFR